MPRTKLLVSALALALAQGAEGALGQVRGAHLGEQLEGPFVVEVVVHGLPIGLSFIGTAFTEAKLFGYAYAYEQATKHRKPPRYLATAEL